MTAQYLWRLLQTLMQGILRPVYTVLRLSSVTRHTSTEGVRLAVPTPLDEAIKAALHLRTAYRRGIRNCSYDAGLLVAVEVPSRRRPAPTRPRLSLQSTRSRAVTALGNSTTLGGPATRLAILLIIIGLVAKIAILWTIGVILLARLAPSLWCSA